MESTADRDDVSSKNNKIQRIRQCMIMSRVMLRDLVSEEESERMTERVGYKDSPAIKNS